MVRRVANPLVFPKPRKQRVPDRPFHYTSPLPKPVHCHLCETAALSYAELDQHMSTVHPNWASSIFTDKP